MFIDVINVVVLDSRYAHIFAHIFALPFLSSSLPIPPVAKLPYTGSQVFSIYSIILGYIYIYTYKEQNVARFLLIFPKWTIVFPLPRYNAGTFYCSSTGQSCQQWGLQWHGVQRGSRRHYVHAVIVRQGRAYNQLSSPWLAHITPGSLIFSLSLSMWCAMFFFCFDLSCDCKVPGEYKQLQQLPSHTIPSRLAALGHSHTYCTLPRMRCSAGTTIRSTHPFARGIAEK